MLSSSLSISEEDCYKIYSLNYGENFEILENLDNFCSITGSSAVIINNETYGKYLEGYKLYK